MTVDEFFNRVEKLITQINDDATLGTNKIGITADQRLDILNANTIEEAITFLLAYNIPQYVVDFAISGQDLAGITSDDAAVAAAREQTGLFGNTDAYIGVPATYVPPREGATAQDGISDTMWREEKDMTGKLLTKVKRQNKIMIEFKGTSTISRTD